MKGYQKHLAKVITLGLLLSSGGVMPCAQAADYNGEDTLSVSGTANYDNVLISKNNSSDNFTGINLQNAGYVSNLNAVQKVTVNISDDSATRGYDGIYIYGGKLVAAGGVDITINSTATESAVDVPWRVGLNVAYSAETNLGASSRITIDTVHHDGYVNGIYAEDGTIKGNDLQIAINQNAQNSQTQNTFGMYLQATSTLNVVLDGDLQIDTKSANEAQGIYFKSENNHHGTIGAKNISINAVSIDGAANGIKSFQENNGYDASANSKIMTGDLLVKVNGKTEAYGLNIGKKTDVLVTNAVIDAAADEIVSGIQLKANDYFGNTSSFTATGNLNLKAVAASGIANGIISFIPDNNEYGVNTITLKNSNIEVSAKGDASGIELGRHTDGEFQGKTEVMAVSATGTVYGVNYHSENSGSTYTSQGVKFEGGLQAEAVAESGNAYAVNAAAGGNVYIHKGLNAYATATGDAYALKADNSSKIKINEKDNAYEADDGALGAVHLQGDVLSTNSSYISAFLSTSDSFLSGSSNKDSGSTVNLSFGDGAKWNMTGDSQVDDLTVGNGTVIDMSSDQGNASTLKVQNLKGSGAAFVMEVTENGNDKLIVNGTSAAGKHDLALKVQSLGALEKMADEGSSVISGTAADTKFNSKIAGFSNGLYDYTADLKSTVDNNGKVNWYVDDVSAKVNDTVFALANSNQVAYSAWIDGNGTLRQRLGELQSGADNGIWVRMFGGKLGSDAFTNKYKTYQIGYDEKAGDWLIGAAYEYTDGSLNYSSGSGENKIGAVSLYGTLLGKDGSALDIVLKRGRIYGDMDIYGKYSDNGDYSTDATSFGVEYSKRFEAGNDVFVEPQLQLTYGRIDGYDYRSAKGVSVAYDDINSLIGRLGVVAGKEFKRGSAYVKASVLHEFSGDGAVTMLAANSESYKADKDYGDTWLELGLGGSVALGKNFQLYGDVERSFGGDITKHWGANLGVQYSF